MSATMRLVPSGELSSTTSTCSSWPGTLSARINRLVYVDDPDNGGILRLMAEEFDELHNYDKEDPAIGLATVIKAKKKYGFHMNAQGHMAPINKASEYCFDLGLSDDLKFNE